MKTYTGQRTDLGAVVLVRQEHVRTKVMRLRIDLRNHSPTGFDWGYGGSGPAQLALALCADATGDDARALKVYQRFKWRFISAIKGDKWQMSQDEILAAVEAIENEPSDPRRSV
jgi:hypothetical protein